MPPFPKALTYVWRAYFRLRRRMAGGFAGPNPIGWPDIDAFVRRSGVRLDPWEIELVEAIDDIYLRPSQQSATPKGQAVTMVSAADGAGVRSLLGSIAARRPGKKGGAT